MKTKKNQGNGTFILIVYRKAVVDIGCIASDPGRTSKGADVSAGKAKGSQFHQVKRVHNQGKIPVCNCGFRQKNNDCSSGKKMQQALF